MCIGLEADRPIAYTAVTHALTPATITSMTGTLRNSLTAVHLAPEILTKYLKFGKICLYSKIRYEKYYEERRVSVLK